MRQIYILTCFFFPLIGFSQLTIVPQGNFNTYVYVENTVLSVENNLDLQLNPDDQIASLYLRKEAQLLQGSQTLPNSGNGIISVFQEGNASAYTYNYWGLPVKITKSGTLLNDVIFEPVNELESRKVELTGAYNGFASPLTISRTWLYKFSGSQYSNWKSLATNFDLIPGEGFTMKGVEGKNMETIINLVPNNPGNNQRYDFRGIPNSGNIILSVHKDESILVGNPYPSALNLDKFLINNKTITGIAYFWDSKNVYSHNLTDYEGGYGTYSPAGGENGYVPPLFSTYNESANVNGITGEIGEHYARQFLPIAQGFMIRGREDGELIFENEYREFVKENIMTSQFKNIEDISFLKLNVEFENLYTRQLMLINDGNSSNLIDQAKDAKAFALAPTDISWNVDNLPFIINVLPIENLEEIPFIINNPTSRNLKFEIFSSQNFEYPLYIHDVKKGQYLLFENGTVQLNVPSGVFNNEYKLAFSNPFVYIDKIENSIKANSEIYSVLYDYSHSLLKITIPFSETASKLELFDVRARLVLKVIPEKDENYFELNTFNLSNGVYILKIYLQSGSLFSKKVMISN